jgi:hypothetical protein
MQGSAVGTDCLTKEHGMMERVVSSRQKAGIGPRVMGRPSRVAAQTTSLVV